MGTYIKFFEPIEEELKKKIKKKGLTITVDGPSGSGKSTGAKAIAKAFNLKYVYVGEIFRKLAKERGLSLEKFCAKREKEVDLEADKRTLKLAMKGNVVLDGRITGWVAGDWTDVKIYYDTPLEIRAKRVAKRDKKSFKDALKDLKKRDKDNSKRYKEIYGIDSFDKSIYDLIIDNSNFTLKDAKIIPVKLVKDFLEKKKFKIKR
ncbi:MAG: cytidylate kinase family protein [Candidatus Aenigmatarchaeota archaeon]